MAQLTPTMDTLKQQIVDHEQTIIKIRERIRQREADEKRQREADEKRQQEQGRDKKRVIDVINLINEINDCEDITAVIASACVRQLELVKALTAPK